MDGWNDSVGGNVTRESRGQYKRYCDDYNNTATQMNSILSKIPKKLPFESYTKKIQENLFDKERLERLAQRKI